MIAAGALALILGAVDPCAAVPAAPVPDPTTAAAYRAVGDEQAALGARGAAAEAYARAAALDPRDEASRAALRRLCEASHRDPATEALARMDAGDLPGAVAILSRARARVDDSSLALLEGICRYELGDDRGAEPLLRAAEGTEDADVAQLYLGLLALRAGERGRAASFFEAASASDALAATAWDLLRTTRGQGPWSLTLLVESGWDSNVPLAPPSTVTSDDADALYGAGLAAVVRPLGASGPYLRALGVLTRQVELDAYDVAAAQGAAGWALRAGRWSAALEYEYAWRTFGGEALLASHQALASASAALAGATLGATFFARRELFADAFDPFSGTVLGAELRGALLLGARVRVGVAWAVARDAAEVAELSWLEHGPRAEVVVAASRRVRLAGVAAATFRRHDAYDAALGARRDDVYLDGEARVDLEASRGWSVRLGARGRRALSNVDALEHDKVVPTLGLAYTLAP